MLCCRAVQRARQGRAWQLGRPLMLRSWLPRSPQISAKDSFEIAFNAACGLLEAGDLPAAEQQLQLAVRVGEQTDF